MVTTLRPVDQASQHMDGNPFACRERMGGGPMNAGKFFGGDYKRMPL